MTSILAIDELLRDNPQLVDIVFDTCVRPWDIALCISVLWAGASAIVIGIKNPKGFYGSLVHSVFGLALGLALITGCMCWSMRQDKNTVAVNRLMRDWHSPMLGYEK